MAASGYVAGIHRECNSPDIDFVHEEGEEGGGGRREGGERAM